MTMQCEEMEINVRSMIVFYFLFYYTDYTDVNITPPLALA